MTVDLEGLRKVAEAVAAEAAPDIVAEVSREGGRVVVGFRCGQVYKHVDLLAAEVETSPPAVFTPALVARAAHVLRWRARFLGQA